MGITVSDIERKEFTYKGAGYDPYDVDQYLDQICDEMVAMQDHIAKLEQQLEEANRELETAKYAAKPAAVVVEEPYAAPRPVVQAPITKTSETLEAILLNAQKLADDAVEQANSKAEEMVSQANQEAEEITRNAREEKERIEKEYADVLETARAFKENFLKMLEEHKALLDSQLKTNGEI